jgi:hypothetical protein
MLIRLARGTATRSDLAWRAEPTLVLTVLPEATSAQYSAVAVPCAHAATRTRSAVDRCVPDREAVARR